MKFMMEQIAWVLALWWQIDFDAPYVKKVYCVYKLHFELSLPLELPFRYLIQVYFSYPIAILLLVFSLNFLF